MSLALLINSDLAALLVGLRATEYAYAASATIWVYDYLLTLDREIALVWRSRWSLGKFMFFLNRYSPIIYLILGNYFFHGHVNLKHARDCQNTLNTGFWFYTLGFLWSAIVFSMEAWAIWGGKRFILIALSVVTMVTFAVVFVLIQRVMKSIIYMPVPNVLMSALDLACAPFPKQPDLFWPSFVMAMIYDTVILVLALTGGIHHYRLSHGPIIMSIFYDGLFYYIYILVPAVAIVVVTLVAPVQWIFFLQLPYGLLGSIFSTRILLNVRGHYFRFNTTYNASVKPSSNSIVFEPRRVIGSMRGSHLMTDSYDTEIEPGNIHNNEGYESRRSQIRDADEIEVVS